MPVLPRGPRRTLAVTAAAALSLAALACAGPSSATLASTGGTTVSPAATSSTPKVTKLLTFVEENHSLTQMQASMPYTNSLAKTYGYATHYTAITHPSLPNYLAIAGGSTFGVTDDRAPAYHKLDRRTVFGQARLAGKTAKVYADGMPSTCYGSNGGKSYVPKHNPWAYFSASAERTWCRSWDRPVGTLQSDIDSGALPNAGMVVPNLCHDAHDCSLATADAWFKAKMQAIMAGPDWKAGRLAVVLTADEDDRSSGNRVLTVVIHPSQHAHVVSTALTHYSLTRLYSQVIGSSTYLRNAADAPDMAAAFGLPVS